MTAQGERRAWQIAPQRRVILTGGRAVLLRPVAPDDGDVLAEFFAALSQREIHYVFALDAQAARRLALTTDRAFRLLAVEPAAGERGPRVMGYMYLEWAEGHDEPSFGACLHEGIQSAGLGRVMLDHLLSSAAASGVVTARLTVHVDNWRALRLYQRVGFRVYDEMILESQGARQYRMRVDLSAPRPAILEDLVVVDRGGMGVGMAASQVQATLENVLGALPLLLDRPVHPNAHAVLLADFAAPAEHPFETPAPPALQGAKGPAWLTSLDERRVLIAGLGPAAVEQAATSYVALLGAWSPPPGPPAVRLAALPRPGPMR